MAKRRERERFDWRFIVMPVLLVSILALGIMGNTLFEGESVARVFKNLTIDNGDEKINWGRYPTYDVKLDGPLHITKPGIYHLTGTLKDGGVSLDIVNTEVKLILDNVTIKNSSGPAIYCGEGEDVVIELMGQNYLEDGKKYEGDYDARTNAAVYVNADLTFQGDGALTVVGNYADGIAGKDDTKFKSGFYDVRARDDGIRGTDSLYIIGGDFKIKAGVDGLKSANKENGRKGFVLVTGGNFEIDAGGKGIEALNAALVRGGDLKIKAREGIESRVMGIDGGVIDIMSTDDGLNVKSDEGKECVILMDGGEVYINASGDGVDANGRVVIAGGKLVVDGPTSLKNSALDSDSGITVKGGEVIAVGSSKEAEAPNRKTTTVPTLSIYFTKALGAGDKLEIKNSMGFMVAEHTAIKNFTHMVVSTEDLWIGEKYNVYINDKLVDDFTVDKVLTELYLD